MNLDELYQTLILDHYREKHHSGLREGYDSQVHHVNPSCGDEVTLRAHMDGDTIKDVSYHAEGCSISQASTSILGDLVIGKDREYFEGLYQDFVELMHSQGTMEPDEDRFEDAIAFAGVSKFPARVKCALLAWTALRDAINQADTKEA